MEIFLHYILPPLIGAVIGYVTNWIAVKMLFRPLYPKYIGKWRLPFTPGIIPRRRDALARAIGRAVGEELLTKDDLVSAFVSEEKKSAIVKELSERVVSACEKDTAMLIKEFAPNSDTEKIKASFAAFLTGRIVSALPGMKIGDAVAEAAGNAVLEKVRSSPLALFVREDTVRTMAASASEKIEEYLSEHGEEKILPAVQRETDALISSPIDEVIHMPDSEKIQGVIEGIYERFVPSLLSGAFEKIDIAAAVEKRVAEMDVKELEKLCLSVMKKELNAVTWLGGLIGLLLGIINIFL